MKIKVLKLARDLSEQDLQNIFAKFGEVESCTVIMDRETNKSKGFAFVEMPNEAQAKAAVEALHDREVNKQKMKVRLAD